MEISAPEKVRGRPGEVRVELIVKGPRKEETYSVG